MYEIKALAGVDSDLNASQTMQEGGTSLVRLFRECVGASRVVWSVVEVVLVANEVGVSSHHILVGTSQLLAGRWRCISCSMRMMLAACQREKCLHRTMFDSDQC